MAGPAATGPTADYWAVPNDPLAHPSSAFKSSLPCPIEGVPVLTQYAIVIENDSGEVLRGCSIDGWQTAHITGPMTPQQVVDESYPGAWGPYFA